MPMPFRFRGVPRAIAALVLALVAGSLLACAGAKTTRPLVTRGLSAQERKDYIIQNGYGIPENVRKAFMDGYVIEGMSKELVFQLYGAPDRSADGDATWEYVNNRGNVITGVHYKGDKVESVYGDRYGGSPPYEAR